MVLTLLPRPLRIAYYRGKPRTGSFQFNEGGNLTDWNISKKTSPVEPLLCKSKTTGTQNPRQNT